MPEPSPSAQHRVLRWMFAVGLAFGAVMVWRSQVGGDQVKLLVLGHRLWADGVLLPYGTGMSSGGLLPGSASSLLTGAPLLLWADYRAPAVLTLLMHAAAYLLLDRALRGVLSGRQRVAFAALYWLNPWRVYHSAHLWNPNWMFLFAAVHAFTLLRMRRRPSFSLSLVHTLAIGIAFQIHGSFLLLLLHSLFLWWRGYVRPHWGGVLAGGALTMASLWPWFLAVRRHPDILPMHEGFFGQGLFYGYWAKGIGYLLRYPSLHFGRKMVRYDFEPALGHTADQLLTPLTWITQYVLGPATLVVTAAALVWLWRGRPATGLGRLRSDADDRTWLHGFVLWGVVATLVTCSLSYTTIMAYQLFTAMHLAVLVPVLALGALQLPAARWVRVTARAHVAVVVVNLGLLAFGSAVYRQGGRQVFDLQLAADHALVDDLGVRERCTVVVRDGIGVELDPLVQARTKEEMRAIREPGRR